MHISQLELYGFKSFAKKTTFDLQPGISCIVGPNGCGKTNVVDAIRWVLGEQKTSVLRSDKMGDVVFNGTEHRRPLSYAEVSLMIHNDNGELPVEYTDVEITRRLYRSGESEYLINKVPVRLKDITDLFLDTGMGVNAYSVIELKMIESILSESHEERKRLFEEAAGINKYKQQRRSTFRKLEATSEDLLRLGDIVREVESKVKNLKQQLSKFKRYEKYVNDLKETEISLASSKLFHLNSEIKPLIKEIEPLNKLYLKTGQDIESSENELQNLKTDFETKEQKLISLTSKLEQIRKRRGKFYSNDILWKEQITHNQTTLSQLSDERRSLQNRLSTLKKQLSEFEKIKREIEPQYQTLKDGYQNEKQNFEELNQPFQKHQTRLKEIQEERLKLTSRRAEIKNSLNYKKAKFAGNKEKIASLTEKLTTENEELLKRKEELQETLKSLHDLSSELSDLSKEKEDLEIEEKQLSAGLSQLREEFLSKKSDLQTVEEKIKFYDSLIQSRQDFPSAARYILDHPEQYPGIAGTLVDFIQIPSSFHKAFESLLSKSIYYLIARDRATALSTIKKLSKSGKGGVTLIPLNDIQNATLRDYPDLPGILGRFSDLIKCSPELKPVMEILYGDCLIVSDEAFPSLIKEKSLVGWLLISESGTFRLPEGILVSGPQSDSAETSLSHKSKSKELKTLKSSLETELRTLDNDITGLLKKQDDLDNKLSQIRRKTDELQAELLEKKDSLSYLDNLISQKTEYLQDIQEEIRHLQDENSGSESEEQKLLSELNEVEQEEIRLAEEITQNEEKLKYLEKDREGKRQILQNKELELVKLDNEIKNTIYRLNSISDSIEDTSIRLQDIEKEEEHRRNLLEELRQKLETNAHDLAESEKALENISAERDEMQIEYNDLRREIVSREDTIRRLHRERENFLEKIRNLELQLSGAESKKNQIIDRIKEKYGLDLNNMDLKAAEDEEKLEKKVRQLKNKIESIGSINMTVREEYEKENSRFEFLKGQQDDLLEAEKSLKETIKQIDKIARKKFREVFEEIRLNFKKTYQLFFEDGEADLLLVGDSDPLEATIDIVSKPGGKKMQPLKMLSAGEKALTAIALLFSIYLVKPSPFCILDEVDAPLDDSNISKFTKVLKKFSETTQFIVVTHNKMTMDAAGTLYGITMEESGISKVVSVILE